MNEGSAKQQIVEAVKATSSILITVSDNPSVDELSAALGLTMILNKLDKRTTAIFSGAVPPAISFLDPGKTFEGTVDSLRDFIIALDKEKADHLRYKVDGDVVKIFITPYRTTLTSKDLDFSQGDEYNVETVIALGVKDQAHLDKAFAAHGRILHDATVATISNDATPGTLGSIDWRDSTSSSLCEMLVSLSEALKTNDPLLDEQIATAFLTGIVSATDRFSNSQTSSRVMTMAAQLMAAGANQQLIAAKLQEAHEIGGGADQNGDTTILHEKDNVSNNKDSDVQNEKQKKKKKDDNSLQIDREQHTDKKQKAKNKLDDAASAVTSAAALEAAVTQAEPAKDAEKELTESLAEVTPSITGDTGPVEDPAKLEKELNEALASEPIQSDAAVSAEPAASESTQPVVEASAPGLPPVEVPTPVSAQDGMPDFEALDVPAAPAQPQGVFDEPLQQKPSTVSDSIDGRAGSSYVGAGGPAKFDTPVDNVISGASGAPDQYVDPFNTPLPALPDLHESKDIAPISPPETIIPTSPVEAMDPVLQSETLKKLEEAPIPSLSTLDLPPLPPMPDFSNTNNLPPLPPPPPPPVFDMPTASPIQAGAVSGDIFGDGTANLAPTPVEQQAAAEPPKPGQFQIPGQS